MNSKYAKIISLISELNEEKMSTHARIVLVDLFNEAKAFNQDFDDLELEKELLVLKGME